MREIDWSKAPEGATHYDHWLDQPFIRFSGCEVWEFWNESKECWFAFTHYTPGKDVVKRPSKAWLGAGLPPVGTVCEVLHKHEWVQCEVVAHKDLGGVVHAIVWIDADTLDQSQGIRLRPIRTQEQIEAEERERAIDEMYAIVREGIYDKYALCSELYDAGYRKQGEGK